MDRVDPEGNMSAFATPLLAAESGRAQDWSKTERRHLFRRLLCRSRRGWRPARARTHPDGPAQIDAIGASPGIRPLAGGMMRLSLRGGASSLLRLYLCGAREIALLGCALESGGLSRSQLEGGEAEQLGFFPEACSPGLGRSQTTGPVTLRLWCTRQHLPGGYRAARPDCLAA